MPYKIYRDCSGEQQLRFEIFRNVFILPDLDPTLNNSDDYPTMLQIIAEPRMEPYYEINTGQNADSAYTFSAYVEGQSVGFSPAETIQLRDDNVSNDTSVKLNATPRNFFSLSSAFKDTWKYSQANGTFQAIREYRLTVSALYRVVNGMPTVTTSGKLKLQLILENRPPRYNMTVTDLNGERLASTVNFQQVGQGFIITIDNIRDDENGPNYFARFLGSRNNPDDNPFYMKPAGNGFGAMDVRVFFRVFTADIQKERIVPNLLLDGFDVNVDIYDAGGNVILDPNNQTENIDHVEIKYIINNVDAANTIVNNKSLLIGLYDQLTVYEDNPYDNHQLSANKIVFNSITINGNTPDIVIVEDSNGLEVNGVTYVMSRIVDDSLGAEIQKYESDNSDYLIIPFTMRLPAPDDLYFGALQTDNPLDSDYGLFGNDVHVLVNRLPEMTDSFPLLEEGVGGITIPDFDSLSDAYRITSTDTFNCCLRIKKRLYWNGAFNIKLFVFAGALGGNGINSYKMIPVGGTVTVNSVRSEPIINEQYR